MPRGIKTTEPATEVENVEAVPTKEPEVVADTAPRTRKPSRTISRRIEELIDHVPVKTMSEPEKIKYIEYLLNELKAKDTAYETLQNNIQGVFEKNRQLEQALQDEQTARRAKEAFVRQAIGTCYSSILIALEPKKGGNA